MTQPLPTRRRSPGPYDLLLPLWRRVVFVDWFGVLSDDLLWHSILSRRTHPYYQAVETATSHLFRQRHELVRQWMRGRIDAATVVAEFEVPLDRRFKADFLLKRLFEDCRVASYRGELLASIRRTVSDAHIVIATDNMDCFASQIGHSALTRLGADAVLVSSELGVLKTDSVDGFFGPWLRDHSLTFDNAVLIDDNPKTCSAFQACGGGAIVFKSIPGAIEELTTILNREPNGS